MISSWPASEIDIWRRVGKICRNLVERNGAHFSTYDVVNATHLGDEEAIQRLYALAVAASAISVAGGYGMSGDLSMVKLVMISRRMQSVARGELTICELHQLSAGEKNGGPAREAIDDVRVMA